MTINPLKLAMGLLLPNRAHADREPKRTQVFYVVMIKHRGLISKIFTSVDRDTAVSVQQHREYGRGVPAWVVPMKWGA